MLCGESWEEIRGQSCRHDWSDVYCSLDRIGCRLCISHHPLPNIYRLSSDVTAIVRTKGQTIEQEGSPETKRGILQCSEPDNGVDWDFDIKI